MKLLLCAALLSFAQGGPCNIPRVDGRNLSYDEWKDISQEPVILTGLIDHWPALENWKKNEFTRRYGHHSLPSKTATGVHYTFEPLEGEAVTLRTYLENVETQHFIIYDHAELIGILNDLRYDYDIPSLLQASSLETILSLGGGAKGATFQRHQVAWLATVSGLKYWYMAHPKAEQPPEPVCKTNAGDLRSLEQWEQHGVRVCDVGTGEILWVPEMWWHATCNGHPYTVAIGGQQYIPGYTRLMGKNGAISKPYFAALRGNLTAVSESAEEGAQLCPRERTESFSIWPVYLAIKNNHWGVVEWMLENDEVCANAAKMPRMSEWAADYGHVESLKRLAEVYGTEVNNEALTAAVVKGHFKTIKWIVSWMIRRKETEDFGDALQLAIGMGREEIAEYLKGVLNDLEMMAEIEKSMEAGSGTLQIVKSKFRAFDMDSDGKITKLEWIAVQDDIDDSLHEIFGSIIETDGHLSLSRVLQHFKLTQEKDEL